MIGLPEICIVVGIVGFVAAVVVMAFRLLYRASQGKRLETRQLSAEDEDILQRLWDSSRKMEERILNLETILMERTGKERFTTGIETCELINAIRWPNEVRNAERWNGRMKRLLLGLLAVFFALVLFSCFGIVLAIAVPNFIEAQREQVPGRVIDVRSIPARSLAVQERVPGREMHVRSAPAESLAVEEALAIRRSMSSNKREQIATVSFAAVVILMFSAAICVRIAWPRRRGVQSASASSPLPVEDEEILQRLWQSAQKMEERITNLETILLTRRH